MPERFLSVCGLGIKVLGFWVEIYGLQRFSEPLPELVLAYWLVGLSSYK